MKRLSRICAKAGRSRRGPGGKGPRGVLIILRWSRARRMPPTFDRFEIERVRRALLRSVLTERHQ